MKNSFSTLESIMLGLTTGLIVLTSLMLAVASIATPQNTWGSNVDNTELRRVIDDEFGVVCYIGIRTIDCLPLTETIYIIK